MHSSVDTAPQRGTARRHDGPEFPCLDPDVPVLRRSADELQLGLEPERGLILCGVPVAFDPLLTLLDGRHSRADIRRAGQAKGVDPHLVDAALDSLLRSWPTSTLADPAHDRPSPETTIRLIGAGRIGRAIAEALLTGGIAQLEISDAAAVDPSLYPSYPLAGSQAEALRAELLDQQTGRKRSRSDRGTSDREEARVVIGPHWSHIVGRSTTGASRDPGRQPLLTVLSSDTTEIDRALTDTLLRADQPHLVVRPWLGGVLVGPLVVPGLTACLSCLDLIRAGADPAWTQLLAQLVRRADRPDPTALNWAAATTTIQLIRWLRIGTAELLGGTIELRPPDYELRLRRWDMHPGCGCSWPVTANWGS